MVQKFQTESVYARRYAQNQLSHKSPSSIAWIGTFQLFFFFFTVSAHTFVERIIGSYASLIFSGGVHWSPLRLVRTHGHHRARLNSPRFRAHDDLALQGVLPVLPCTGSRIWRRMFHGILVSSSASPFNSLQCFTSTSSPALSSIAHWYNKKRGSMMGLTTAGSSLGGVVFPIALNKLIPRVGFPWVS